MAENEKTSALLSLLRLGKAIEEDRTREAVFGTPNNPTFLTGVDPTAVAKGVRDSYLWPALARAQDAVAFNPYSDTASQEALAQVLGPPAEYPGSGLNRVLHGVGQDLPVMAPFLGVGGAGAILPNLMGGSAGSAVGRTVEEAGGSGLASFAADMGADTLVSAAAMGPLAVPVAVTRAGAKGAGKRAVREVVKEGAERAAKGVKRAGIGFDPEDMRARYPFNDAPEVKVNESGKEYLSKVLSPEAESVMKLRKQIDKEIKKGNYEPFFPVEKRFHVDPNNYDMPERTSQTLAKKPETIEKWRAKIDTPQARARLKEAYERGLSDLSSDWYAMGQLEEMYVKQLGPDLGRKRFDEHMQAIAATTGGNDPTSNWLMSRWGIFEKARGNALPEAGWQMPAPIGGRYAGSNAGTFNSMIVEGKGIRPDTNPKRYDFTRNFLGFADSGTIDEQMTKLMTPDLVTGKKGKTVLAPPDGTYGIYQDVIQKTAKEMGVDPRWLQEVAWAGAKRSEGKPMIQHINESIERTAKVTGLSPAEVVKGWIDETLPAYGFTAGGLGLNELRKEMQKENDK